MLMAAVLAVAACGIPLQAEPQELDIEISPVSLAPAAEEVGPTPSFIFLVREGFLLPVDREPVTGAVATMGLLLDGPTLPEEREGLRTAIPTSTELLGVADVDGVTVVDLTGSFANIGGADEILAVGQIVTTLGAAAVSPIRIHLDGVPVAIPLPDGALTMDPVTVSDYEALLGN